MTVGRITQSILNETGGACMEVCSILNQQRNGACSSAMTSAAQKEIFRQALALPLKARLDLYNRLIKSLESSAKPRKAVSGPRVIAEPTAVYGRKKAPKRIKVATPKAEILLKKAWNEAWKSELEKRIEDIDSGKVKCIPYAEARKGWNKILGKI